MSSGFSVQAAAAESPDGTALLWDGGSLSFGELAQQIAERPLSSSQPALPLALEGRPTVEDLLAIYAAIEQQSPFALLHPSWPAAVRRDVLAGLQTAAQAGLQDPGQPLADDERTLAIVYTSGSEGAARGVVLSRRAFARAAEMSAERLGWQPDDRWLLSLPVASVGGLSIITRSLAARQPVVLPLIDSFDAEALANTVETQRVTLLSLVPTTLRRLVRHSRTQQFRTLRCALVGGAAADPDLIAAARAHGIPAVRTYGATETCAQLATEPSPEHPATSPELELLDGVEARTRGGVLELRSPALFSGYWPEQQPPLTSDGWFRTNDCAEIKGSALIPLGRADHLILTGGKNVHPLTVEQALQTMPEIAEICVFGVEDPEWGQVVVAAIVPQGDPIDPQKLLDFGRQHLEPAQRVRQVALLEALPRNPNGKLDRSATQQLAQPRLLAL